MSRIDPRVTQRSATIHFDISELSKIILGSGRGDLFGRSPSLISDFEASQYKVQNIVELENFLSEKGVATDGLTFETVLAYAKKRDIQRKINLSVRNYVFETLANYNEDSVQYRGFLSVGGNIDVDIKVNIEAELAGGEIIIHFLNPHHLVNSWFKRGFYREEIPADLWISNREFKEVFLQCLPKLLVEHDFGVAQLDEITVSVNPQAFYDEFYKTTANVRTI